MGGSREVSQGTLLSRKRSVLSSSSDSHANYNRKKGANPEIILLRVNQGVSQSPGLASPAKQKARVLVSGLQNTCFFFDIGS